MDHLLYSSAEFENKYTYSGNDLGAVWTKEKTFFRLWAPTAEAVTVLLYASGNKGESDCIGKIPMTADTQGTWTAEKKGDLNGVYYTYLVHRDGSQQEVCDPYARTTGINGQRAMVIDLASTDPEGWETDRDPHFGMPVTDALIYELHIRDLSCHESAGILHKGKFLGLTESGTKTSSGIPTGLDHIRSLGITHLHILPMYDYGSVDESDSNQFNWGYDPVNFNVPEGSYSTDPYNGAVRVKELKQMVKTLHENGISVVMDVVYNHVFDAESFCFNRIVPGYFSRRDKNGVYSNGSFCGNDTASERSMVRKYIVDSVKYWADEYHIDGFRFDLVGLIDTDTIRQLMAAVRKDHPNVIFYGEGWTMPTVPTKENVTLTTQPNAHLVPGFAFFSDGFRDSLRGTVLEDTPRGFVSGATKVESAVERHYLARNGWSCDPAQTVQYVSCHDNRTLFDQLHLSCPEGDPVRMSRLAAVITMTAQGIPFLQAGEEFLRSKPYNGSFIENSYNLPDSVNSLKWNTLEQPECAGTLAYYKGLFALRKACSVFRLPTAQAINDRISIIETGIANTVLFRLDGDETFLTVFNANPFPIRLSLPVGMWDILVDSERAGTQVLDTISSDATIAPVSALVLRSQN